LTEEIGNLATNVKEDEIRVTVGRKHVVGLYQGSE